MSDKYKISIEDATEVYDDALLRSREFVEDQGLTKTKRPKSSTGQYFDGHLPHDIAQASLSDISEMLTMMTVFADYVQELGKLVKSEKDNAEEKLKFIKAEIRKNKVGAKSDQDDATITDIRYVTANAEYLTKLYSYEAITAREEAARRDIKTLSRLISTEQISNDTAKQAAAASPVSRGAKRWR